LGELLDSGGITLIEWGDTIRPALPADYLEVSLELGDQDDDRIMRIRVVGRRWAARFERLEALLREAATMAEGGAR
jgi:tRNA A37 threonylcarbamoyladenosine biosynthesis protein TsaE